MFAFTIDFSAQNSILKKNNNKKYLKYESNIHKSIII